MKSQVSGDFYRSLFDNMLDGLAYCQMLFDAKGQPTDWIYVEVNKSFERLTGLKDVVGKKVTKAIPGIAVSNPELFEIYGRVSLTGKSESFETYVKPLQRWFFVSVYSPEKKFFMAVFQDTTGRKQIEEELKNARIAAQNVLEDLSVEKSEVETARAKEEAILMSVGDGLISTDENGNITLINKSAEKLFGRKGREIVGKSFFEAVLIEDENGVAIPLDKRPINKALTGVTTTTTTTTTSSIYYYVRPDKTKFPVAITATPVKLEGRIIGTIEVFRDITSETEVDKAKSEFVSLASHQLRTPLGIIKWFMEALESEEYIKKAPQVIREYFNEIYKSNERVLSLVRNLLSVSRIDQGRVKNDPKLVDVMQVIKEIIGQMQIVAGKKKITLYMEIPDQTIPSISIDILRFHEVIENLIVNAIEYTEAGGKITVSIKMQGDTFFLSVKDTGIGISEADQKKLFDKFFRSEKAIGFNVEGSGLGLYVVKSYVEGWGGKIMVESAQGKGSTFTISLPI